MTASIQILLINDSLRNRGPFYWALGFGPVQVVSEPFETPDQANEALNKVILDIRDYVVAKYGKLDDGIGTNLLDGTEISTDHKDAFDLGLAGSVEP